MLETCLCGTVSPVWTQSPKEIIIIKKTAAKKLVHHNFFLHFSGNGSCLMVIPIEIHLLLTVF